MGLMSFFKAPERGVYLVCVVLGLIAYMLLRPAIWAPFAGLMITYHLFVLYMVMASDKDAGRSYNLPITIGVHLLCVALLIASKFILAYGYREALHSMSPVAGLMFALWAWKAIAILQYLITYGLATYERDFLFADEKKKYARKVAPVSGFANPQPAVVNGTKLVLATGQDHHEWLQEKARSKATFYAPGTSPEHEFEQWLRARGKTHYASATANSTPTTV